MARDECPRVSLLAGMRVNSTNMVKLGLVVETRELAKIIENQRLSVVSLLEANTVLCLIMLPNVYVGL